MKGHPKRRQAYPLLALAVVVGLILGACSQKDREPFRDAPRASTNKEPAEIITMPDGFSNVAAKCDGTTRVYVVFKSDKAYGSIAVSPSHPACGGSR